MALRPLIGISARSGNLQGLVILQRWPCQSPGQHRLQSTSRGPQPRIRKPSSPKTWTPPLPIDGDIPSSSRSREEAPPPPSRSSSRRSFVSFLLWTPVVAFIGTHIVSFGAVNGGSMSPTLNPDYAQRGIAASRDYVFLDRSCSMVHDDWHVGDIVVLMSPSNPDVHLTKRILALPGDVVRYPTKKRKPLKTSFASSSRDPASASYREIDTWARIRVPPGHCWIEGDSSLYATQGTTYTSSASRHGGEFRPVDRRERPKTQGRKTSNEVDMSQDSRHFGPVPLALLTARVVGVVWPLSRFGSIPTRLGFVPKEEKSTSDSPGQAGGLDRGWWPWGGREQVREERRIPEDSPLTHFKEDQDLKQARRANPPAADDENVTVPLSQALLTGNVGSSTVTDLSSLSERSSDFYDDDGTDGPKRTIHKVRPLDRLSPEEKEERRRNINALSRGGRLGDFVEEEAAETS